MSRNHLALPAQTASQAIVEHMFELGPVAPSWFSAELDQVGRRELVHDDCALHHF